MLNKPPNNNFQTVSKIRQTKYKQTLKKWHQKLLNKPGKNNPNKLYQQTKFKLIKPILKHVWLTNKKMFQKNVKQSNNHAFKKQLKNKLNRHANSQLKQLQ